MKYNIEIEVFKGPFDLLFHLIEKNKIDIYDIPISEIVDQYIDYLYTMESLNLEIASEFLVMASTLIHIKSKLLLPSEVSSQEETEDMDIDPRDELVKKLLEYKKYKIAAAKLKEQENYYNKLYFKAREELIVNQNDNNVIIEDFNITNLLETFERIISKKIKEPTLDNDNNIKAIYRESITIEDQINKIMNVLKSHDFIDFNKMFVNENNRLNIIISFLAVLELIKRKEIITYQEKDSDNITIKLRNKN
ncbi:MAG: segregation/condensation protein A [Clostridiales bacterium]|nr:segregation/condensation protein A [Clostridiales bacterium]